MWKIETNKQVCPIFSLVLWGKQLYYNTIIISMYVVYQIRWVKVNKNRLKTKVMLNLNLIIKKICLNSCNVLETIVAYKTRPKQQLTTTTI